MSLSLEHWTAFIFSRPPRDSIPRDNCRRRSLTVSGECLESRCSASGGNRLVIGVDFGTTYSGVAYVSTPDFPGSELDVIKNWPEPLDEDCNFSILSPAMGVTGAGESIFVKKKYLTGNARDDLPSPNAETSRLKNLWDNAAYSWTDDTNAGKDISVLLLSWAGDDTNEASLADELAQPKRIFAEAKVRSGQELASESTQNSHGYLPFTIHYAGHGIQAPLHPGLSTSNHHDPPRSPGHGGSEKPKTWHGLNYFARLSSRHFPGKKHWMKNAHLKGIGKWLLLGTAWLPIEMMSNYAGTHGAGTATWDLYLLPRVIVNTISWVSEPSSMIFLFATVWFTWGLALLWDFNHDHLPQKQITVGCILCALCFGPLLGMSLLATTLCLAPWTAYLVSIGCELWVQLNILRRTDFKNYPEKAEIHSSDRPAFNDAKFEDYEEV